MDDRKSLASRIPGLGFLVESVRYRLEKLRLRRKKIDEVFTDIYRENAWESEASVSGSGSDLEQTRTIARELPRLFEDLGVKRVLDVPCGDFGWMSTVDLSGVHYTGADIVEELVERNRQQHGAENVHFELLNLTDDDLPQVDLIFCRDCLPHFSFSHLRRALENVCRSGSTYFLTTTFTGRAQNKDIATGQWRPLNLEAPPLSLPAPERIVVEECTEAGGAYADKSLGLWRVEALREWLADTSKR